MKFEGGILELIASGSIFQAIELVDLTRNTSDTEAAIKNGFDGLESYLDQMNAKLENLSKEMLKEHTLMHKKMLKALLTLNVCHRNYVRD